MDEVVSNRPARVGFAWGRRGSLGAAALAGLLVLAACGSSSGGSGGSKSSAIKVGYVTVSGPAAASGVEVERGIDLAVSAFNASSAAKATAIKCEDNVDVNTSTACTQKLITQQGAKYLLIDTASSAAVADAQIAKRANIVTMLAGPRDNSMTAQGNPLLFRVNVDADVEATNLATELVQHLTPKKVAFLAEDNPFGHDEVTKMKSVLGAASVETPYASFFPATQTDFSSQLASVKSSGADVLVMLGEANQGAIIAKQAKSAGVSAKLVASSGMWTPDLLKLSGGAMNEQYGWTTYPESASAASKAFQAAYTKQYGGQPSSLSAESYTGMLTLLKAIGAAKSRSSSDVAKALAASNLSTPLGVIKFDSTGQNTNAAVQMQQASNGKFVTLS